MSAGRDWKTRRIARGAGFAVAALRGSGQVIFMASPWTGVLNIAALCWGAWAGGTGWPVVLGAVLGALLATAVAGAMGLDRGAWRAGLYGFNGLLVGAALPTFLAATPSMWVFLGLATTASAALARRLERALQPMGLPGLTFPFIVLTWLALALAHAWPSAGLVLLPAPAWSAPAGAMGALDLVRAVAVSVAQVFFVDNAVAGAIFLLALAVHSRAAALLAALGAAIGVALAWAMGADRAAIAHGMWGYAAALTAPAVGCVFARCTPMAVLGAVGAAVLTVGVQALAFALAGAAGGPSLTIAFVLGTWGWLLARRMGRASSTVTGA